MRDQRVVYTTGVFDLFHIGHLNLLTRAKALGGKLIVGVSTDEVVSSYKPRSAFIHFEERIQIVSALRCVDECIPQTNRDKFLAWQTLRYDILVCGDDWQGHPDFVTYERQLDEVGARVVYLPYTRDTSSTQLRQYLDSLT